MIEKESEKLTRVADSTEEATVFKREDYAGPGQRLAIVAIDGLVLIVVALALGFLGAILEAIYGVPMLATFSIWPLLCVLYLGPLHATRLRTLGYFLLGYKLVDYRGRRPNLYRTLVRVSMMLLLSIDAVTDVLCSSCPHTRQSLWDRLAETTVVRTGSQPQGRAALISSFEFVLGKTFVSREAYIDRIRM